MCGKEVAVHTCRECVHSVPDMAFLSVNERKPILSRCIYSEHATLLRDRACPHYEEKK